jgi:hypothetical protein
MIRTIRPWTLGFAAFATTALLLYVDAVSAIA